MGILRLGLDYAADPFIAFFAGIVVLYVIFLFIDNVTGKVSEKRQDDFDSRFRELFRQAKRPAPPREDYDKSTVMEVENLRVKMEDDKQLFEDILGKQYKEKETLKSRITGNTTANSNLSNRFRSPSPARHQPPVRHHPRLKHPAGHPGGRGQTSPLPRSH